MKTQFKIAGLLCFSILWPLAPQAQAEPVDYVRVCDAFGADYYYIPGTETCVNSSTGETRKDGPDGVIYGQTDLARRLGETEHQSAIPNALQQPDLVAGERFGLKLNWGAAGSFNALGVTGAMVLGNNIMSERGRLTASGGVAFSGNQVGGNVGLQLSW